MLTSPTPDAIRYTLRFPAPHTHYVEVEAVFPAAGRPHLDLFMAVWTPGSYLVREYQRHVEQVTAAAADGAGLPIAKTAKNRWRVDSGGAASVTVRYRVYGREMTVRNNWIEAAFAMINGAPTFISMVEAAVRRPHEVRVELPDGWSGLATALPPVPGQAHTYRAADFDTLVDNPWLIGHPVTRQFEVGGKPHHLVLEGDTAFFDVDRAVDDTRKIVEASGALMGQRFDYPHYYFLNLLSDAGGGLEHENCFLVMANRFTTRTRRAYLGWLMLVAHEYFHVWNGKRLRPIELGPFDYEREVHSKALWIVEGFTDYYAGLLVARANLATRDEYLEELSSQIDAVQSVPGRLVTPVDMASFDTWIKQYRPDENTPNTTVNYYPKGAVIAWLLDAAIRRRTGGARSLDDVMREAYARYSGERGFTIEQFYQLAGGIAGADLKAWFRAAAESTGELDYTDALDWFGLRFKTATPAEGTRAWIGATTRTDGGRLLVAQVRRETPAFAAGLNVDDEILAIDDVRVRPDALPARLENHRPGERITILVARRDRLMRIPLTLGVEPGRSWRLDVDPRASEAQRQHLIRWLSA